MLLKSKPLRSSDILVKPFLLKEEISRSTSALDPLVVEVSESRPLSNNFVRLAFVVVCPSASLVRLVSSSRSDSKVCFDTEPVGCTRFSCLWPLRRRKWARSFLSFSSLCLPSKNQIVPTKG